MKSWDEQNIKIPFELFDLMKIYEQINNVNKMALIPNSVGKYFRLSHQTGNIDVLMGMRFPGSDEEKWKHRKKMISIGTGENLNEKDIDQVLDVILRGLKFGVGLVLPNLPCVIQFQLMDMMKKKNISVLFASRSMSIGVNYPIRSAVIMATEGEWCSYPVSTLLQMAGRCGRRGKDTEGNLIFWGISNADEMDPNHLGNLSFVLGNDLWYDDDEKKKWMNAIWKIHKERGNEEILEVIVREIGNCLGWTKERKENESNMLLKMKSGIWMQEWKNNYTLIQDTRILMNHLLWIYLRYHTKDNKEFLYYLQYYFFELRKFQYKLLHFKE